MTLFGERNPRRTQVRFLRELFRILKPDGQLFIAIENRWGYEYFTGRPDHHSGLLAGSLLPRIVANAFSIVRKHRPYRTYTHTFGGLQRVLRDGGFMRSEVYGLSPGYSSLGQILPAATDQPFWQPTPPTSLADRVRRGRRFVPAFGIVGQRSPTRPTPLVARLLDHIAGSIAGSPRLELHECWVTGKDKGVLMASAGALQVVIKLPAADSARAGEAHHHAMLELLHRRGEAIAPEPLGSGMYQGVAWFAERRMRGVPLSRANTVDRDGTAIIVADFVKRMGPPAADVQAVDTYRARVRALVTRSTRMLAELGIEHAALDPTASMIEALLARPTIKVGLSHGDLSVSNLFVEAGAVCGAIDWEYAYENGLPPLDFLAFMESRQRLADPKSTAGAAFIALARGDWPCKAEIGALKELYAVYGLRWEDHEALCRLAWLTHVSHQLNTSLRFDEKAIRRLVDPIVQWSATAPRTGP